MTARRGDGDRQERQDRYVRGTTRRHRPAEIVDQHGDTWVWVDADRQGVPGYKWAGGGTHARMNSPLGPARTRSYVEQARGCHLWRSGEPCTRHDHSEATS